MRNAFQIAALVTLATLAGLIVFVVNAPKWLDGRPTTRTTAQ